jgi:hypothetical protein
LPNNDNFIFVGGELKEFLQNVRLYFHISVVFHLVRLVQLQKLIKNQGIEKKKTENEIFPNVNLVQIFVN